MLWRVLSFDLTNVIFAVCFTLRGHDTLIDFLRVLSLVGRIGPLIQNLRSLLRLNKVLGCLIFSEVPSGTE